MKSRIHRLKTWPDYYQPVALGKKNFEIRVNDREYRVGDRLDLMEWDPKTGEYTGDHCHRYVTYILGENPFFDLGGSVVMSLGIDPPEG